MVQRGPGDAGEALAALRDLVARQTKASDGRLPAERALAARWGVSRRVVRECLGRLADEGLVVARGRSGWRVTGQAIAEPPQTLIGFGAMARMYGYRVHTEVLTNRRRAATAGERAGLELPSGEDVVELVRRRLLDDRAVSVEATVLAWRRGGRLAGLDLTDRSLFDELALDGQRVGHSELVVEADAAGDEDAARLGVAAGSPVLVVNERCFDEFGAPLFLGLARYRHDAYRVRTSLWSRGRVGPR